MTTKKKVGAMLLLAMAAGATRPEIAAASSHREAPMMAEDPSADNTDVWAFTSPDTPGTVTILAGYIGLEEPGGGPNWARFSDDVLYEIKIDNNGDGNASDVVYQFRFTTTYNDALASGNAGTFFYNVGQFTTLPTVAAPGPALRVQTYTVTRVENGMSTVVAMDVPTAPVYSGRFAYGTGGMSAPDDSNYTRIANMAVQNMTSGNGRVFAGPRDDPFFADLGSIFDDVTFRTTTMGFGSRGGGIDYLSGYNVHMIALQVPVERLVVAGTPTDPTNRGNVVGIYATASRPRVSIRRDCNSTLRGRSRPLPQRFAHRCMDDNQGQFVQVSRLGLPLVNEVLIPLGEKDFWNRSPATDDVANFGQYLLAPSLPTYTQVLYGPMGLRAAAGYMAPTRPVGSANIMNNDMLQLVSGNPGVIPGTPTAGFAAADLLRLNVRTAASALPTNAGNPTLTSGRSRLGAAGGDLQGFPNGRRIFDDIIDIELRYVLNTLGSINAIPFGDGVDGNDVPYSPTFPYAPIPHAGTEGPRTQRSEAARPAP